MKIHLPNSAFIGNIDSFIAGFDPSQPGKLDITANEKWISIHPVILCMIACLGLTVDPAQIHCAPIVAKSGHYLKRMGLFDFLKINSNIDIIEHEPSGRFIPLKQIKTSEELTFFLTEIIPLLHLEARPAESIRYVVSELVRNVLEHSLSPNGAIVSAQYFKKSNVVRIGIADTGLGIKKTINQSHGTGSDLEALRLALTPGITGTTKKEGGTEQNAGAGLFFIKSIATVNRDFFMLYSGNALYKLLMRKPDAKRVTLHADPFEERHSKKENLPYWQGTVVGMDISLDSTSELTFLLDLIRKTYHTAIKERKKARYKKARFI